MSASSASRRRLWLLHLSVALLSALAGLSPSVARADEKVKLSADGAEMEDDDPHAPPNFDLAVGTLVPLSIGGQATLEIPGRVLFQVEVGWMPPAYGSAINGLVQSVASFDEGRRRILDGALEDALVVRASVGWRPFTEAGFEITGGYTNVRLSGTVTAADMATVAVGEFADEYAPALEQDVALSSQLHNFHVGLGWRWVIVDHVILRATIGYTQTLASSSEVSIEDNPAAEAAANPIVDEELGALYRRYAKLPMVGLSGGYRF